ncbi:hypothetical protein V2J09_015887 [Rumex salicifolius]
MAASNKVVEFSSALLLFLLAAVGATVIARVSGEETPPRRLGKMMSSRKHPSSMENRMVNDDLSNPHAVADPEGVVAMVHMSIKKSIERRKLNDDMNCGTGNPIDDCWRCDPDWHSNRKHLANCAIGFGSEAIGGRDGEIYVVKDPSDSDPGKPTPGTLRHAVIQEEPLWIVFQEDMVFQLKGELIVNSFKTIDGRGAHVHIANGGCVTIRHVTNVVIHGVHIHDCVPTGNLNVSSSPTRAEWVINTDGDGITVFNSSRVWIDHCSMWRCADGLVDATMGSTAITISNNHFTNHNEVMLLGHNDSYVKDKHMQVTIAFNHFGEGLIQRMPRHGYFHVVNNDYTHWEMYAIGGSANPTINSQGNRYLAPSNPQANEVFFFSAIVSYICASGYKDTRTRLHIKLINSAMQWSVKKVTKRIVEAREDEWKEWNWRSEGDLMLNGAFFTLSGAGAGAGASSSTYAKASSLGAMSSSMVGQITADAGPLLCHKGQHCYTN